MSIKYWIDNQIGAESISGVKSNYQDTAKTGMYLTSDNLNLPLLK